MNDSNPLLQPHNLVNYAHIRLEHLKPAITRILDENRSAVELIISSQAQTPTWSGLVLAMDALSARVDDASNVLVTLALIPQTDDWQAIASECWTLISDWHVEVTQSLGLFKAYQTLAMGAAAQHLSPAAKTLLAKKINAFNAAGLNLADDQKTALITLNEHIQSLEHTFFTNVQVASRAWSKLISDESLLAGLSQPLKNKLALKAIATGREGWLLTLDEEAIYNDVMAQCENRALRQELLTAYSCRASDHGPMAGHNDNGPILEQLLERRHHKAHLLGYDNYAQLSLQTKIATSTEQVMGFLKSNNAHKKPQLAAQMPSLKALASSLGYSTLQAWDYPYVAHRLSAQLSGMSDAELQAYFPFNHVLDGLILIVQRLFDIQLVAQLSFSTWHHDVMLFEVRDKHTLLGHIYIDPFFREPKADGCWTQAARDRRIDAQGNVILPVAIFHGNFSPASDTTPCLLSPLQLRMLFHEFGHCLQQVLTLSDVRELSSILHMGKDASEFAGKMLEQWCLSPACLLWISRHYQTAKALSSEQVGRLLDARKVTAALETATELLRSQFDFEVHLSVGDGRTVQQVLRHARTEALPLGWPENDQFANTFDYMVTGYEAGYYTYEWAESLAQKVFTKFENDGIFNQNTGQAFRDAFFSPGDERSLLESFEHFMGAPAKGF
ncbi:M3 family metallopeptidase [Pseudomonas weihenstephanensis]|uniref:M3 family metallopeptidase n=1 Tax=Pseudomonas weihenstephanensis TaxID=1608994 RepID=UPI0006544666|nr:M3 family metallopeptidase [Pseudomonas weihenstephanensis]KMN17366.1 hypothetical protein TU87_15575 [Pseudomonas weihenstephanensis]MBM1191072.1 M3 family metallopeptidase [Pseudomonas weihenstephanensis]